NLVRQVKRENNVYHAVPPALIEEILNSVSKKLSKKQPPSSNHHPRQDVPFRAKQNTMTPKGRGEASLVLQKLQTELLPDGYFKKPRNTAEVRSELESRFHIKFLSRKVSQALGELNDRRVLSRVGSKYEFQYFTP